jgi:hypothetical protein
MIGAGVQALAQIYFGSHCRYFIAFGAGSGFQPETFCLRNGWGGGDLSVSPLLQSKNFRLDNGGTSGTSPLSDGALGQSPGGEAGIFRFNVSSAFRSSRWRREEQDGGVRCGERGSFYEYAKRWWWPEQHNLVIAPLPLPLPPPRTRASTLPDYRASKRVFNQESAIPCRKIRTHIMKLLLNCKNLAALTVLIGSVSSLLTPEKLEISAAFPTNNQFGIVFNGQPNKILQVFLSRFNFSTVFSVLTWTKMEQKC